jgi:hypothetical protein
MDEMKEQSKPIEQNILNYEPQADDSLKFDEVVIFYNLVFDIGDSVNPTEAARKLLETDLALSAANYLTEDIEIASRFKELADFKSLIQSISKIQKHSYKAGIVEVSSWIMHHPSLTWNIWRKSKRIELQKESDPLEENDNGGDSKEGTEDTLSFLDNSMMHIQLFEAFQRRVDRMLFTPQYLKGYPFARISLQPFFAKFAGEELDIDAGVLIHRTGVAILTFYVVFKGQKTVEDLVRIQQSTTPIENLEVVRLFAESSSVPYKPSETRYSGGVEWFAYQDMKKATLEDIFGLYQNAIISAIKGKKPVEPDEPWSWLRCPIWRYYPIVFLRHIIPEIGNHSDFKERYPKELAGLVMRSSNWKSLKNEKVMREIGEDQSISENYSLYINSSHATVLYYEPYRQSLIRKFGAKIPKQE